MLAKLTKGQREKLLAKVLRLFLLFCQTEFQTVPYRYQIRVSEAILRSLLVEPLDIFIKIARQSGKTEILTLLLRFLIVYHLPFIGSPLLAGIASPKGEQAKTDVDRIKKSIQILRSRWQLEDRENNDSTIRAYRNGLHVCDMFKFSLAPTTQNESKTLNILVVEESHKADHEKRRDQLDPMLASTGGFTVHLGVGCPIVSDFKKGCDGHLPGIAIVVNAEEVCRDRRQVYEQTGDARHLAYERKFREDVRKYGRQNPEIRRNYFLEDTVEEGNFISREHLIAHARASTVKVPEDVLYLGVDWARRSDHTWATIGNGYDVIDWLKVPHVPYAEQVEIIKEWVNREREGGKYLPRIQAVLGDSTGGAGDAPMEMLAEKSGLPIGEQSHFVFTKSSKNDLYLHFENLLFTEEDRKFTYPADHPLAAEFEEQMTELQRAYTGDGEYLSVHHPETAEGRDDAPDATALMCFAGKTGKIGDILWG